MRSVLEDYNRKTNIGTNEVLVVYKLYWIIKHNYDFRFRIDSNNYYLRSDNYLMEHFETRNYITAILTGITFRNIK